MKRTKLDRIKRVAIGTICRVAAMLIGAVAGVLYASGINELMGNRATVAVVVFISCLIIAAAVGASQDDEDSQ